MPFTTRTGTAAPGVWGQSGRLDVFVQGTDNALYHEWWDGTWHGYEYLGGSLQMPPTAVSWGANRLDVFVDSTDNAIYHRAYTGQWQAWEQLVNNLNPYSPPAASAGPPGAVWGPYGRLDVYVRGNPSDIYHVSQSNNAGWSGLETIGTGMFAPKWTAAPVATAGIWNGTGRLDLFDRWSDYALYHTDNTVTSGVQGQWIQWEKLGGIIGN